MLTLEQAIAHCEEKAKELREQPFKEKMDIEDVADCEECAEEHEQLAAWLKELKAFKEAKANSEQESKQYALGYQDGFLDAKKQFEGDLNNAIRTIKTICQENNTCNTCPMNWNCNEQPAKWKEAKGGAEE